MPSNPQRTPLPPLGTWQKDPRPHTGPAPRPSDPGGAEAFEAWFFQALVSLTLDERPSRKKR